MTSEMRNIVSEERKRGLKIYEKYFGRKKEETEIKGLGIFTIDHLFANIWSREEQLSLTDRSKITIALLAALGIDSELKKHLAAAKHLGIPREEIVEIMIHVAHYAGWPAGRHAIGVLDDEWKQGK